MKLIGKFNELTINNIILYKVPLAVIKETIKSTPNIEIIVKEHRIGKPFLGKDGETIFTPNPLLRHQVLLNLNCINNFLKISLYSVPMNVEGIRKLELLPIDKVERKERTEIALKVLTNDRQSNSPFIIINKK